MGVRPRGLGFRGLRISSGNTETHMEKKENWNGNSDWYVGSHRGSGNVESLNPKP